MKFRTQYDDSLSLAGHGLHCPPEEGRTNTEFADDCDINKMMARYEKTGRLPEYNAAKQIYGDFSQVPDFAEMRMKVIAAENLFASLPAKVRASFDNDPGAFIDASTTPEGMELLVSLGLATPKESPPQASNPPSGASPSAPGGALPPPSESAASKTKKGE